MTLDELLGQGAIDARFTDWNAAREFVIFDTIVNNPRLTDPEKVDLQRIEEDAYRDSAGKWTQSEREEIARYYNYLKNNFPSATKDARFLAVFDAADKVKAATSETSASDVAKNSGFLLLALGAIGYLYLRR